MENTLKSSLGIRSYPEDVIIMTHAYLIKPINVVN